MLFTAFLGAAQAFAADGTWTTTGTGNWSNIANWNSGAGPVADGAGFTATFASAGATTIHLDNPQIIGNLTFNAGAGTYLLDNNGVGSNILTLDSAAPTISVAGSTTVTISAVIAGTAGLTKANFGGSSSILALTGSNTYSGTTTISGGNAGFVQINSDAALGTSDVLINSQNGGLKFGSGFTYTHATAFGTGGGRIDTNGFDVTLSANLSGTIGSGSSFTKVGAGTLTLSGANTISGAGGVNVSGGALKIDSDARLGSGTGGLILNGGGIVYGAAFNNLRNITLGNSDGTLDTNGFNVTYSGTITGTSGQDLKKAGLGTLTLTGTQTYAGTTIVNAGTLLVNGTHTSAAVTVNNAGSVLGGTGTIGGATTIGNGASLNPGTSAGLLTFSSNLTFNNANSKANFEIASGTRGANYDAVDVGGLLTYNGDLTLTIDGLLANGTYDLFGINGGTTGSFDTIVFAGAGPYSGSFTNVGGVWTAVSGGQTFTFSQATGDLMVVPEPGTMALVIGAGIALVLMRRRRSVN